MKTSVGPIVGLLSAACIAVPAGTGTASAAATSPAIGTASPASTAHMRTFDRVPPALRLVGTDKLTLGASALAPTVGNAAIDGNELLQLATLPYHNLFGVATAAAKTANTGLEVAFLPLSLATLVAQNKTDSIPGTVSGVEGDVKNAFPNFAKAVSAELQYDQDLFEKLTNAINSGSSSDMMAAITDQRAAAAISGNDLLAVVTIPIHNAVAVTNAVDNVVNTGIQVALVPVSVASLVLMNKTDTIPAYLDMVQSNVANTVPNFVKSIQSEVDYDRNLIQKVLGGTATGGTTGDDTSTVAAAKTGTAAEEAATKGATDAAAPAKDETGKDAETATSAANDGTADTATDDTKADDEDAGAEKPSRPTGSIRHLLDKVVHNTGRTDDDTTAASNTGINASHSGSSVSNTKSDDQGGSTSTSASANHGASTGASASNGAKAGNGPSNGAKASNASSNSGNSGKKPGLHRVKNTNSSAKHRAA